MTEATVPSAFEAQASRTPDATAVVSAAEAISYGELDRRANYIAERLRGLGVGPEVRVGILVERSVELIVALLGVLKAGGCYLPLDPAAPVERWRTLLADAKAGALVSAGQPADALGDCGLPALRIDRAGGQGRTMAPIASIGPDNLAYVIYTSGSTGRPKGVAVTQRSVVHLVTRTDYASFGPDEVVLQFAPMAFDLSTFEVWWPLLNGGRLVIAPPGALTPDEIGNLLRRHAVTTLWLTSGLFHLMVDEGLEWLGGLRQMLAGGDVVSPTHAARFLNRHPHCRLINGYGPTETTTLATTHALSWPVPSMTTVPIGVPFGSGRAYVLDAGRDPLPAEVPGELYVGGPGVARGYLDQPGLTAERFFPDPYSGEVGARMYRTGDLARRRSDGVLEFLGRMDDQVKIRGFRVEPEETRVVLERHPSVRACAVVTREDGPGERQLVAYIVAVPGARPRPQELRAHVGASLPEYMVPAGIVQLDALPLTANGKLDRRALPTPPEEAGSGAEFVLPCTEIEERLAAIWGEVLRRERIGVYDDFFSLGGHSLLATQAVSRVCRTFDVDLPARALFEAPTVRGLAERVAEAQRGAAGRQLPAPVRLDREAYRVSSTRPQSREHP
jgi:amino acid adenylation domain-containing protein